jgi:hypothetical protein
VLGFGGMLSAARVEAVGERHSGTQDIWDHLARARGKSSAGRGMLSPAWKQLQCGRHGAHRQQDVLAWMQARCGLRTRHTQHLPQLHKHVPLPTEVR